jgi:DNA-binding GntR family transcriptional regulator
MPIESRHTKKDLIVEELRRLIQTGELSHGERVRQDELADRFDASTTPVREAMRQLEAEGLLIGEPNKGVRVATPAPDQARAVYVMRRLLEPYAAQRATFELSRRDLRQLLELADELEKARTPTERTAAKRAFDFLIFERMNFPALDGRLREVWFSYPWHLVFGTRKRARETAAQQRAIVAALESGDVEQVGKTYSDHIAAEYASLMDTLGERDSDPFALNLD